MAKTVSAYEARTKFGEILNLVYYKDMEIIVEKMGKPMIKMIKVSPLTFEEKVAKYAGSWSKKESNTIEKEAKKLRKTGKLSNV